MENFALHPPGYNFMGPGHSDFSLRPTNVFDYIAWMHDIEYAELQARGVSVYTDYNAADDRFINRMENILIAYWNNSEFGFYFSDMQWEYSHRFGIEPPEITPYDIEVALAALAVFKAKREIAPNDPFTDVNFGPGMDLESPMYGDKHPEDYKSEEKEQSWMDWFKDTLDWKFHAKHRPPPPAGDDEPPPKRHRPPKRNVGGRHYAGSNYLVGWVDTTGAIWYKCIYGLRYVLYPMDNGRTRYSVWNDGKLVKVHN